MVFTILLSEASALFSEKNGGRLFTIMRHPIEMIISSFFYLGKATWERNYKPELQNMTLLEFAKSDSVELRIDNWMTRYLARNIRRELRPQDMDLAKGILKYKCLVGMMDHFVESMERIHLYFGLVGDQPVSDNDNMKKQKQATGMKCVKERSSGKHSNKNEHETFGPESKEWKLLAQKNQYDMELYEFAKELWKEQGIMLEKWEKDIDTKWNYREGPSE